MNIEKSPYTFKGSYRGRPPSGIVLHAISEFIFYEGRWMACDEFLSKIGLGYHEIILSDSTVLEMQSEERTVYHAGKSDHNGRTNLNTNYLGICFALEGRNTYAQFIDRINNEDWVKPEQFDIGLQRVKQKIKKYNIDNNNIVRHSDVSGDDVRGEGKGKQDTGDGFDYVRFIGSL